MTERATMTFHTSPDVKVRMQRLAQITRRSKSFLTNEAVERYLAEEEEFIAAVNEGAADADAGRVYTEPETWARIAAQVTKTAGHRNSE